MYFIGRYITPSIKSIDGLVHPLIIPTCKLWTHHRVQLEYQAKLFTHQNINPEEHGSIDQWPTKITLHRPTSMHISWDMLKTFRTSVLLHFPKSANIVSNIPSLNIRYLNLWWCPATVLRIDRLIATICRAPSYLLMAISMLKIRRPLGRLIFNMGIAIPGKTVFLIETAPWSLFLWYWNTTLGYHIVH